MVFGSAGGREDVFPLSGGSVSVGVGAVGGEEAFEKGFEGWEGAGYYACVAFDSTLYQHVVDCRLSCLGGNVHDPDGYIG